MARDWESWLATASGPASPTEDDERDRTEKRIRDAITATDLSSKVRIYAKGSYANNTNVRRDADVDIAVEWNNTIQINRWGKTAEMTPAELGYTPVHEPMTPTEFRQLVEQALIAAFGVQVDTAPDKCIGVGGGAGTLDADVVPCFAMHRYDRPRFAHRGHWIYPKKGGKVANYPQQNLENGNAKNAATRRRYKEIVRCTKRLISELFDEGKITRDYPGYLVESLVFNVPDDHFGSPKRYDAMRAVLAWLWNGLRNEDEYSTWTEPSGLIMLFRGWPNRSPRNAFNIIDKAWDQMEFP